MITSHTMEISPNVPTAFSNPIQVIKNPADISSFRLGDVVQALVLEKLSSKEVLLAVKESEIAAQSALPLNVGDRLLLQVAKTHPMIVLKLIIPDDSETLEFRNNLVLFRSFPEGLFNVVKNGLEIFQGNIQPVYQFLNQADIDAFLKILNTLIYSEKSLTSPLFLKEFIMNIGYLMEKNLKKSLDRTHEKGNDLKKGVDKNIKSILARLSCQLHQIMDNATDSDLDPMLLKSLKSLSDYTADSLKMIYNQQVVNVFSQEEQQGYYFQLPIKFADNLRMVDLFIRLNNANKKKTGMVKQFQFVLFFNMDPLGDLIVDVRYMNKKIWGLFKCDRSESRDFLSDFIETLNERLILSGYGPNSFNIQLSRDLSKERSDYLKDTVIYSKKIVNCFA